MSSTITSSGEIPAYVEQPIKSSLAKVQNWASKPTKVWGADGQNPVADFSSLQKDAISTTDWMADQDLGQLFGYDDASDIYRTVASGDANFIGEDQDAYSLLGGEEGVNDLQSYMSPYLQEVLDPVLRENQQSFQRANNEIGHSAQGEGAFGDARHGVAEGQSIENYMQQNSDSTAKIFDAGFNQAVSAKTGDLSRLMQADLANQAAAEAYYQRLMGAGDGIAKIGQQDFENKMKTTDAQFNAGQLLQNQNQNQINADQAIYEAINNQEYNKALAVISATQGTPYVPTTTQVQSSDSGKSSIFGSIAGSLASSLLGKLFG